MFSLLSVNGRIGRGTWWMVQIGILVVGLVVSYVFEPAFPTTDEEIEKMKADPALAMQFAQTFFASIPILIVLGIINTWLFITSSVQRLHDRGSSGWRILFWYVPLLVVFGSFYALFAFASWTLFIGGLLLALAGVVLSVVWLFIECGMLAGDDFENDYGDPPNAEARRESFEKELRQLRREPEPVAQSRQTQVKASQSAMAFTASSVKSSFGKR